MYIDSHLVFPPPDEPISKVNYSAISSCSSYLNKKIEKLNELPLSKKHREPNLKISETIANTPSIVEPLCSEGEQMRLKSLERQVLRNIESTFQGASAILIYAR